MQLAQFPEEQGRAVTEDLQAVGKASADAMRRFIEDQGAGQGGKRSQEFFSRLLPRRWKAAKIECGSGQACCGKGGGERRGARDGNDPDPLGSRQSDQDRAWIGDARCAGIGDQGDIFPGLEPAQ